MPKKAVTFREIFALLAAPDAQKYLIKNWTSEAYSVKRSQHQNGAPYKVGYKGMVPLGGALILERLLGIGRTTQERLNDFYEGKSPELPQPQPPFFANLAQLLIALDDQGTPLVRPGDKTPIVFREAEWNGLHVAPWMQLRLLYDQEAPSQYAMLSPFMAAHARNSSPVRWDNPPTILASRLFALMRKLGHSNADDLATALYGGDPHHPLQPQLAEVVRKIIAGEPLNLGMDSNGALSLLAVSFPEAPDSKGQFSSKQVVDESTQPLPTPAANSKSRAFQK